MEVSGWYSLFGFGMLGGILPTSAKLATTLVSVPGTPMPETGFVVGLIIWAIIGGAVALTNTSKEVRQAVFAGIAAPAVLAGVVSGATGPGVSGATAELFGMSAVAQEVAPAGAGEWTVIISPTVNGGFPTGKTLPVTAEVEKDGQKTIVNVGTVGNWRGTTAVQIPSGTSQVFIGNNPVPTSGPITSVDMSVKTAPSMGGDLLWALGAQRNFNIQSVDVTHTDAQ